MAGNWESETRNWEDITENWEDAFSSAAGYVTSIQSVSIAVTAGNSTNTATITSVDTDTSFLIFQGQSCDATTANDSSDVFTRITRTNATTVTATRSGTTGATTINAVVIEGTANLVDTVQFGTVTIAASSATDTVTSVDTARSSLFWLGQSRATSSTILTSHGTIQLTNATTITGDINNPDGAVLGYVLVEFQDAAIESIQEINDSFSSNTDSTHAITLSAVTEANTLLAYKGTITSGAPNDFMHAELTSTTNVDLIRGGAASVFHTSRFTVIEFVSGVLESIQRGVATIPTSTLTKSTDITAVDLDYAFINYTGITSSYSGYDGQAGFFSRWEFTDSDTIIGTRDAAYASATGMGYEIVQFSTGAAPAGIFSPVAQGMGQQFIGFNDGTIDVTMHKIETGISA